MTVHVVVGDGRVTVGGVDVTDACRRVAVEVADGHAWAVVELDATVQVSQEVAEVLPSAGHGMTRGELVEGLEAAALAGMGYGSASDSVGQAIYAYLRQIGVV